VDAPSLRPFGRAVVRVFPDLRAFDVSREILLEIPVTWEYVGQSLLYAGCYVLVLLVIAAAAFSRRDFV
jgi:ABC-type transport system involved in multi-copper enzyme maturation permease subunit